MFSLRTFLISVVLIGCLLTAGCSSLPREEKDAANTTDNKSESPASYRVSIAQPDARSDCIRMDSDVYNVGEVVEFTVINDDLLPLECPGTPPGFTINFQTGSGRWVVKKGTDESGNRNISILKKGESTPASRFTTNGWEPGRYRIVSDCGPEHEILVRSRPPVTTVPTICPPAPVHNTSFWITIDPFGDPLSSRPFTIRGSTNIPAGQELSYSIFSVQSYSQNMSFANEGSFTTVVEEGSCGVNYWSAMGEIQATGDFFIGISDTGRKAVTTKRFTVSAS
jgi:hypothetical protein